MQLEGFRVENFKGIKRADLRFADHDSARVHTLVGLNESGKTTLLEALHSFFLRSFEFVAVKRAQ